MSLLNEFNAPCTRRETSDYGTDQPITDGPYGDAAEHDVRAFVARFSTPNTRYMLRLCESGIITWAEAHKISRDALAAGLTAVKP